MAENRTTTYAVVTLIVGILVGAGVGYAAFHCNENHGGSGGNADDTYWFYIDFGDNGAKTKWYSATGSDAAAAFDKAMKDANMKYEINKNGYISSIGDTDGLWSMYSYLYKETTKNAADNSILYPLNDDMGLAKSNGWASCMGYDVTGDERFKAWEMDSEIFFFSIWVQESPEKWSCPNPVTTSQWMTDPTGPFASA